MTKGDEKIIELLFENVNKIMMNGFAELKEDLQEIKAYNAKQNGNIAKSLAMCAANREEINNINNSILIKLLKEHPWKCIVTGFLVLSFTVGLKVIF